MSKKNFRLNKVLDVRSITEKQCLQEYAAAKNELAAAEDRRLREVEAAAAAADEIGTAAHAGVDAATVQLLDQFAQRKRQAAKRCEVEVAVLELETEQRREELVEAAKDKKVVEKLKERHGAQVKSAARRQEGVELDEVAINRHGRRKGE